MPNVRLARAHSLSGVSSTASLPALDASLPPSRSSASRIMATRSLYNGITDAKRARARLGIRTLTHTHA